MPQRVPEESRENSATDRRAREARHKPTGEDSKDREAIITVTGALSQLVRAEPRLRGGFKRVIEIEHQKTLLEAEESAHIMMTRTELKTMPLIT